jgi:hypothetical protein
MPNRHAIVLLAVALALAFVAAMPASAKAATFTPLPGADTTDGFVYTLLRDGDRVYIGGSFRHVGSLERPGLAALDASTGKVVPEFAPALRPPASVDEGVRALILSGPRLYVGGKFVHTGTGLRNLIALHTDASPFPEFRPQPTGTVRTLGVTTKRLYVGGDIVSIGGKVRRGVASLLKGSGTADARFAPAPTRAGGLSPAVFDLGLGASRLFVGGAFASIGGRTGRDLAALSPATGRASRMWTPAVRGSTFALTVSRMYLSWGGSRPTHVSALRLNDGRVDSAFRRFDTDSDEDLPSGMQVASGLLYLGLGAEVRVLSALSGAPDATLASVGGVNAFATPPDRLFVGVPPGAFAVSP